VDSTLLSRLERAVSVPRMQTYRNARATDEEVVVLYLWNQALSESLYTSLSFLEVAMRSAMHDTLTATLGATWFPTVFRGQALIDYNNLVSKLTFQGVAPPDSQIVANLTFGKWVHLIKNGQCKWVDQSPYALYNVFPHYSTHSRLERNRIHEHLLYVLELRNRVMHHEPIFGGVKVPNKAVKPIDQVHSDMLTAIGWIDVDLEKTVRHVDRFNAMFRDGTRIIRASLPRLYATL
jgi:hypothetical protein